MYIPNSRSQDAIIFKEYIIFTYTIHSCKILIGQGQPKLII